MEYKNVLTTCVYCGCGCGLYLEVLDGRIIGVWPSKTHQVADGKLCIKGWNTTGFVYHPDRLKTPLIRKNGELVEANWDEALSLIAERYRSLSTESSFAQTALSTNTTSSPSWNVNPRACSNTSAPAASLQAPTTRALAAP